MTGQVTISRELLKRVAEQLDHFMGELRSSTSEELRAALAAPAQDGWIPVSERLPMCNDAVILIAINVGPRGSYTTDQYAGWRNEVEWSSWPHSFKPTHWRRQEPPPKESK